MRRIFLMTAALCLTTLSACTSDPETAVDRAGPQTDAPSSDDGNPASPAETTEGDVASDGMIEAEPPVIADGTPVESINADDRPPVPATTAPADSLGPEPTVPRPVPDQIARVISLEATHTETLFAIGAGDLVVGVDPDSDFPAAAVELQRPGLERGTADLTEIETLEPDLVIVGRDPTGLAARLAAAGIPVWQGDRVGQIEQAFDQMVELGAVVGRADEAGELVDGMRAELAELRAELPPHGTLTYFHEVDPGLTTVAPGSFADAVYAELGLVSLAPTTASADFAQFDSQSVIDGDPDVIVLADAACCGVDAAAVTARPGWGNIDAVRTGAIAELPDRVPERWGPRLIDWLRLIAAAARTAAG